MPGDGDAARRLRARPRHLRTRAQFQVLLARKPVARTAHFALHRLDLPATDPVEAALFQPAQVPWLGAMVPKRWARRAVTRNAIRRQIHALGEHELVAARDGARLIRQHAAFAVAQFPSASSAPLKRAVRAELLQLLEREPS